MGKYLLYILIVTNRKIYYYFLVKVFFIKLSGIAYIFSIGFELNIYCIMSEFVESESAKFSYAIYEIEWFEFRKKSLCQDIHITMIAVGKPLLFYIFGLFPLNMQSYVAVSIYFTKKKTTNTTLF